VSQLAARGRSSNFTSSKRNLIAHNDPRSPIAEQYRTLRTNIQFSAVDETIRSIMVTSAGPGEGKSTTAANLAIVFAQQGKSVLMVDADLRKPTAHYTFQVDNHIGLTNVLTKQSSLRSAVSTTEIEHLSVMPSGPIPPNPAELLGSRMMEEFLKEAYEQFDLVIFDTPPVLAVTDGQILANRCDGTVLVVSSGITEVEAAAKAKDQLDSANARILGVLLNRKKASDTHYYYYYGRK
jgi:protein-tyrosine kinase